MATKKTTKEIKEELTTVETVKEGQAEVQVKTVVEPKKEKSKLISNAENVSIYSAPSLHPKNKIGTMIKGTAYDVEEENVESSIYGKFYHITEGYVFKENNFTFITK